MRVFVRAELVELSADLPGQHTEIAGVDADRAEFGARHLDGVRDALGDVVGVDEQGGADAERIDLGAKRRHLVGSVGRGVQQRERVGAGAQRGHAVAPLGLEVGRAGEPGEVGGPCGGRRRPARGCGASPSR